VIKYKYNFKLIYLDIYIIINVTLFLFVITADTLNYNVKFY